MHVVSRSHPPNKGGLGTGLHVLLCTCISVISKEAPSPPQKFGSAWPFRDGLKKSPALISLPQRIKATIVHVLSSDTRCNGGRTTQ